VDLARRTFKKHGLSHLKAEAMTAEAFFKSKLVKTLPSKMSVIVDPPRAGLGKFVCEKISSLAMKQLIYVACDPATQARDLKWLMEMGGFNVSKAALFDLYPNTHHMETALVLSRE
jgi:tRNA/tmRNA/rRNA uracil-C5-methylase (TrmA/RlmC/RlmD family)